MNVIIRTKKEEKKIETIKNKSILSLLQEENIYPSAPCGGKGRCGKCKIKVMGGRLPVALEDEKYFSKEELDQGYRLACLAYPEEDIEIDMRQLDDTFIAISDFQKDKIIINSGFVIIDIELHDLHWDAIGSFEAIIKSKISDDHYFSHKGLRALSYWLTCYINEPENKKKQTLQLLIKGKEIIDVFYNESVEIYGIAVDLGTTTLAFKLVDLQTGKRKATHVGLNNQRVYGADVITRIEQCVSGEFQKLVDIIKKDIVTGIENLLQAEGVNKRFVYNVAIAGNSVMSHILLGLLPESLGKSPFITTTLDLTQYHFQKIFDNNYLDCQAILLPGISAYVGADIMAGILYHELFKTEKVNMLIDIGTNGEIVIGNKNRILATATATGPALEGGNISCGIGSVEGAIKSIAFNNGSFQYEVIGGKIPIGLCGSSIIDIVAEGLKHSWIDTTGVLCEDFSDKAISLYDDKKETSIKFTQKDIREVQLAKSAVRSGIECLLKEYGVSHEGIDKVYLAGGFGSNINIDNAVRIGLIPDKFRDKISISGNACLGGVVEYLCNKDCIDSLDKILKITNVVNLSSSLNFNNLFIDHMYF